MRLTDSADAAVLCRHPRASLSPAAPSNGLDQFYTKPAVAKKCLRAMERTAGQLDLNTSRCWFVEPAAGCGCFYQLLPSARRTGIDIAPRRMADVECDGIDRADYLQWSPPATARKRRYVVIGNPPFGKRGKLAVAFFNHSAFADLIAFVVPVIFRKYFIHRQLHPAFSLVGQTALANDSFCLPDGKPYSINAEFQVWTRLPHTLQDRREHAPAAIAHPDFEMRQYNNTAGALAMFDARFDFAVPCQGYQDYTRRETGADACEKHKQWMLFTANDRRTRARLMRIDFAALAAECATATPGFRKNDVVRHYATLV